MRPPEGGRAQTLYGALVASGHAVGADPFDCHVAAAILTLAAEEAAEEDCPLAERSGLDSVDQAELALIMFGGFGMVGETPVLAPDPQEQALRDILWMNAGRGSRFERLLARMIARRALRPNHLWQDLGLGHRGELTELMRRHFPRLAQRNHADMKWKKFFYRMMCSSEGFTLCAAPVCTECDDFDACFGSEDGEALLAQVANGRVANGRIGRRPFSGSPAGKGAHA